MARQNRDWLGAQGEQMVRLSKAAASLGVDSRTLRRWLEDECGLVFPRLGRGSSPFVDLVDILAVVEHGRRDTGGSLLLRQVKRKRILKCAATLPASSIAGQDRNPKA